MTVTNHKDTAAMVVVIFNNGYGDNLSIRFNGNGATLEKENANEYRWRKLLRPDE